MTTMPSTPPATTAVDGPASDQGRLRLHGLPGRAMRVVAFAHDARIGAIDRTEIVLAPAAIDDGPGPDPASWVGVEVRLDVRGAGNRRRSVHGVVVGAAAGTGDEGLPTWRLELAPWPWWLERASARRTRLDRDVRTLASDLVAEIDGATVSVRLAGEDPPRPLRVQWDESAWSFLRREAARIGAWVRIEHTADGAALVVEDGRTATDPILRFDAHDRATGGTGDDLPPVLERVGRQHRLVGHRTVIRSHDPATPRRTLMGTADPRSCGARGLDDLLVVGDGMPGLPPSSLAMRRAAHADVRSDLLRLRVDGALVMAGDRVQLHDLGPVVVVSAAVEGSEAGPHGIQASSSLHTDAWVVADRDDMPLEDLLPARPALGLDRAVVVGPDGGSPALDERGAIPIRFHWDAQPPGRQGESCHAPLATMLAGDGWGTQMVPRVGQEVLVSFTDGDPARPVVVGAIRNGDHQLPCEGAPETSSIVIRSHGEADEPGSELRMVDAPGRERLHLRAAGGMESLVVGDEVAEVRGAVHRTIVGPVVVRADEAIDVSVGTEVGVRARRLRVDATESIVLRVGASTISISPGGVAISAPQVRLNDPADQGAGDGGTPTTEPRRPVDVVHGRHSPPPVAERARPSRVATRPVIGGEEPNGVA